MNIFEMLYYVMQRAFTGKTGLIPIESIVDLEETPEAGSIIVGTILDHPIVYALYCEREHLKRILDSNDNKIMEAETRSDNQTANKLRQEQKMLMDVCDSLTTTLWSAIHAAFPQLHGGLFSVISGLRVCKL